MDDRRVGLLVRALRRRRGWRQVDLAAAAGVSQATISRLERGFLDQLTTRGLRQVLAVLEVRCDIDVRWRGGAGDRLIDERHATLGVRVTTILHGLAWQVLPEVTFQHYGERGSIDLLGLRAASRAACVVELKSAVHSYEEMQRTLDVKSRLVAEVVWRQQGWRPRHVGTVLVLEGTTTNRRRLRAIESLVRAGLPASARDVIVRAGLPASARDVRRWLADPCGPMRGLWFLPPMHERTVGRRSVGPTRVRVAASGDRHPGSGVS